jgi:flagellar hook assembly protein FlgD
LSIRNIQGQLIETRELGDLTSGQHAIQLDASRFANGLYTYTVSFNGSGLSGKFSVSR